MSPPLRSTLCVADGSVLALHDWSAAAGVPRRGAPVVSASGITGHVTASARSPQLGCGIALLRFEGAAPAAGTRIAVETDAGLQQAVVTEPPFFDAEKRIARGLPLQA
jgi:glycine cleavage system aminomethyltransferase T